MFWKTRFEARALSATGVALLLRKLNIWPGVVSLAYHRIGEPCASPFDHDVWSTTPEQFDAQVRYLKRNFAVIGPADLPDVLKARQSRCVLITFDDGYRDNYTHAFPILKSHGVGATFFVSTGFIDSPRPSWWDEIAWMVRISGRRGVPAGRWLPAPLLFDRPGCHRAIRHLLSVYKGLEGDDAAGFMEYLADATGTGRCGNSASSGTWMTWDMLRQMRREGMWIGGHTMNHPILARLVPDDQRAEIRGCAARLQHELGQPMKWFSYPRGKRDSFNQATRQCLADAGVEFAFSYYGGFSRFDRFDPYDIRRSAVEMDVTRPWFEAMLALPQVFA
jgi:peptidoglycan/xylan/chitin deacetylase (PgdA/CDA1 family)